MADQLFGIDERFAPLDVRCLFGEAQSGRSSVLIEHARAMAHEGASVLFVCTNEPARSRAVSELFDLASDGFERDEIVPDGESRDCASAEHYASEPSSRGAAGHARAGRVRICFPPDVALDVLSTPQAQAAFGRAPRILEPYEQDILMEDMKVCQMKNRRLRALSGYLFSGWANLFDDGWEQTYEEDLFIDRLDSNLRLIGGVLPCEASNLALKILRESEDVRRELSYDWVIVDDFELASRASQHMLRALASSGFLVSSAMRPGPAAPGEPDPCFDGAAELARAIPACTTRVLRANLRPAGLTAVIERLSKDDALPSLVSAESTGALDAEDGDGANEQNSGCDGAFSVQMCESPEAELLCMAKVAADAVSSGLSVMILGANRLWRRNVKANFERVGLSVSEAGEQVIKGKNLENPKVAARIERACLARLVDNPDDGVCWRALLAAGDHVARSAAIDKLRVAVSDRGGAKGIGLSEALDLLRSGKLDFADIDAPIMDDLLAAYERARTLVAQARESSQTIHCAEQADLTAADDARCSAPADGRIVLCSTDDVAGRSADVVILGGFVNGVVPCRAYFDPAGLAGAARDRERTRCIRLLDGTVQAARKRLVVTGFTHANLQIAETMDLHIASIKLKAGVRVASIEPSEFLQLLEG